MGRAVKPAVAYIVTQEPRYKYVGHYRSTAFITMARSKREALEAFPDDTSSREFCAPKAEPLRFDHRYLL